MYSSKGDCGITDSEFVCGSDQDYSTFSVRIIPFSIFPCSEEHKFLISHP